MKWLLSDDPWPTTGSPNTNCRFWFSSHVNTRYFWVVFYGDLFPVPMYILVGFIVKFTYYNICSKLGSWHFGGNFNFLWNCDSFNYFSKEFLNKYLLNIKFQIFLLPLLIWNGKIQIKHVNINHTLKEIRIWYSGKCWISNNFRKTWNFHLNIITFILTIFL